MRGEAVRGIDGVHVWWATLDDFRDELGAFQAVLSADERVRASKFHSARSRDAFVLRRGILRALLASYRRCSAPAISFSYTRLGKPSLAESSTLDPLYFNSSHSDGVAVVALTSLCPVGVDVERLRALPDCERIASRFFTGAEARDVSERPPEEREERFFEYWTCKEAVLKATGDGIGGGLATIHVAPGVEPSVVGLANEMGAPGDWRLRQLRLEAGRIGAVAYRHDSVRLSVERVTHTAIPGVIGRRYTVCS